MSILDQRGLASLWPLRGLCPKGNILQRGGGGGEAEGGRRAGGMARGYRNAIRNSPQMANSSSESRELHILPLWREGEGRKELRVEW